MESTKQQGELKMEAMQQLYQAQSQTVHKLETQIKRLGDFILSLDCGFPTINDEYPTGMGATEAAEEYIKQLRRLGAAVSASPQPRCPQCGTVKTIWIHIRESESFPILVGCTACESEWIIKSFSDFAQFFAAAPAQEPRWERQEACFECDGDGCPNCEDRRPAQEQPVENSPQKGNS